MTVHHSLEATGLTSGYGATTIVDGVDIALPPGRISVIVGANACGKSTLLKTLSRLLPASAGSVVLDGKRIDQMPTKELARTLGLLPQQPIAPEGIAVADLVGRGRHPHQKLFRTWTAEDERAVTEALAVTGVTELADRPVDELSGGQRQRVWLAMILAQETSLLLLDEPTTYLDIAHQIELLELLSALNRDKGHTVVAVLHDLNHACRYGTHIIAMSEGRIVAQGAPRDIVTAELVEAVFGLPCMIIPDPLAGTPMVIPRGSIAN